MLAALRVAACLITILLAAPSHAETYPSGNVRIVVPYPPGGPTDVMARLLAQKLCEALGQQFFVENRPGASGTTGTIAVANAAPDGYTLLVGTPDFLLQPIVKTKPPYDAIKQFTPITQAAASTEMIAVNPSVPAKNLQELIALLEGQSGQAPIRHARRRHSPAPRRRVHLQDHLQGRRDPRAVPGRRAGHHLDHRRTHLDRAHDGALGGTPAQGRQTAGDRDSEQPALAGAAGRSDARRIRPAGLLRPTS